MSVTVSVVATIVITTYISILYIYIFCKSGFELVFSLLTETRIVYFNVILTM